MDRTDVLIVGGGPAGSTCAARLTQSGFDVVVMDRAVFPRDKVCAGWITPAVVRALDLDLAVYGPGRTLQPFYGFRTGALHGPRLLTDFGVPVSYGIRRVEFDHYLLGRSGARLRLGESLATLRQDSTGWWVANDAIRAPVVIGAGGHFCPVARHVTRHAPTGEVVVAREVEFRIDAQAEPCQVRPEYPELFFWPDLAGYGWCVRKGDYLNIGAGRLAPRGFPSAMRDFESRLESAGFLSEPLPAAWKGHAYLLARTSRRPRSAERVLLIGDAAGLALAPSGEGILAAVESGVAAADTIVEACGDYSVARLSAYDRRIEARFGRPLHRSAAGLPVARWAARAASRAILRSPRLTRRWLLEDWFLHTRRAS